jgi:hypothetical protein
LLILSLLLYYYQMLDARQLLMLFAGTLTYLKPKLFLLIVFYDGPCIILKH